MHPLRLPHAAPWGDAVWEKKKNMEIERLIEVGERASHGRWSEIAGIIQRDGTGFADVEKSVLVCELAYYGQTELVCLLLGLQADPNYRYEYDRAELAALNLNAYPGTTALGQSILGCAEHRHDTTATLKALIDAGANPDRHTYRGYTPLQLAIVENCPNHAKLLFEHGADPAMPSADMDRPSAYFFARDVDWAKKLLNSDR